MSKLEDLLEEYNVDENSTEFLVEGDIHTSNSKIAEDLELLSFLNDDITEYERLWA